jgi:outer membrane protein OmpU
MRKFLLASTAIAGAVLYSQSAQAQITVSLGGYTEFFGAYYDDDAANRTSREFELETEIVVRADGKADNGLLYGAKVELRNSTPTLSSPGVGTDEASVYLSGTWGRIELGDFDGAADTMAIYAPLVGLEQIEGDAYDFLDNTPTTGSQAGFRLGNLPSASLIKLPDSGDATKIMYVSPRFAGIQAGVSYATQNNDDAQSVVPFKTSGAYKDFWEFATNYKGDFAGFTVAVGATASTATGQDLGIVGGPSLEDFFAWQAGAQLGYGGFKFGGGYYDGDDFNAVSGVTATQGDTSAWHVGASYTAGPLSIGVTYADAEGYKSGPNLTTRTAGTYASDYKTYGGGVAYILAPGFALQADLMYVDEELRNAANATADNEGYVAVVSTRLDF